MRGRLQHAALRSSPPSPVPFPPASFCSSSLFFLPSSYLLSSLTPSLSTQPILFLSFFLINYPAVICVFFLLFLSSFCLSSHHPISVYSYILHPALMSLLPHFFFSQSSSLIPSFIPHFFLNLSPFHPNLNSLFHFQHTSFF